LKEVEDNIYVNMRRCFIKWLNVDRDRTLYKRCKAIVSMRDLKNKDDRDVKQYILRKWLQINGIINKMKMLKMTR